MLVAVGDADDVGVAELVVAEDDEVGAAELLVADDDEVGAAELVVADDDEVGAAELVVADDDEVGAAELLVGDDEEVVGAGELVVVVAVGVLVAVDVAVGVALLGVPELQVTELPSAERTQVIFDPLLPDGVGAEPGTAEPAPGFTADAGVPGGSVMEGRLVGAGILLTEPVPAVVVAAPDSGLVTEPAGTTVWATALRASARPT